MSLPLLYTLNIEFSSKDLEIINNSEPRQQVIILTKSDPGLGVVWLAFDPFEHNTIQWGDDCQLYGSTTPFQEGNVVEANSPGPTATAGIWYTFLKRSFHTLGNAPPVPPATYAVLNDPSSGQPYGFGLAQAPTVNGKSIPFCPVQLETVPNGHAGMFSLPLQRTILLRSGTKTAQILNYVPVPGVVQSAAITLTFSKENATQGIGYDSTTGTFVPSG